MVVAGAVVLTVLAPAAPASAHAVLRATTPSDRSRLEASPTLVTMEFSEHVSASIGSVRVVDGAGRRVDNSNLAVHDTVVSLGLGPDLEDGAYIVTWRVVSADAHAVRGAFTFSVGDGAAADDAAVAAAFGAGDDRAWEVLGAFARGLAYSGTLLAAGGGFFLVLAHDGGRDRRRLARVVTVAAVVGAGGVVAALPVGAALATGQGLDAITRPGVAEQVLADGVWASQLLAVAGLALVLVFLRRPGSTAAVAVVSGAALAAGSFALSGHTRTTSPAWLSTGADVVHVISAAAWFGGVVLLGLTLHARKATPDPVAAGRVVTRFSRVATVAVLAVGAAGFALGWAHVRTPGALFGTAYGRLLLAKMAVVGVVAAAGAYNHFRLVPALEKAPRKATVLLARTVRVEGLGMVVALAFTAVLVTVTPARTAAGVDGGIFSETRPLGDGSVNLVVDPGRQRGNEVHLYLLDASGRSIDPSGVGLSFSLPAGDLGPLDQEPFAAGPGHYQVNGADFPVPGTWQVVVTARTDRFTQDTASFAVPIQQGDQP